VVKKNMKIYITERRREAGRKGRKQGKAGKGRYGGR
jgi:hypothetical protein